MSTEIRASYIGLEPGTSELTKLELTLRAVPEFEVASWQPAQLEGRMDSCVRNSDLLVIEEGNHDGELALQAVAGLRDRYPVVGIVAALRAPTCPATVALLDAGVDEVVDTTGDLAIATARIMAVVRRRQRLLTPTLSEVGDLKFDHANHRVWNADRQLRLSPLEYAFLDCLVSARGKSVGTRTLSDFVWTSNGRAPRSKNAVQVYVGYLRRKLSIARVTIQNVRGKGYRLVADGAQSNAQGR